MNSEERRALLGLISVVSLRMFGLFLVIPIISLYASGLVGATPLLIGLALGGYGLTQALLQIPFGWWSDKVGRKPVIVLGLCLFGIGGLFAAMAKSVLVLILARALQGAGAISAATMALLADLTRTEQRTKGMALFGVAIGTSFILALVFSPILENIMGVPGMLSLSLLCAALAIVLILFYVPNSAVKKQDVTQVELKHMVQVFKHASLWRLDLSVFLLHGLLAMAFVVLPLLLANSLHVTHKQLIWVYGPVLVASFILMLPLVILAERKQKAKQVLLVAIALLALGLVCLSFAIHSLALVIAALFVFFAGFNVLEATLPSWVSKVAPSVYRGTALGAYASSQFLGMFCGALFAGWLLKWNNYSLIFEVGCAIAIIWLLVMCAMPRLSSPEKAGMRH